MISALVLSMVVGGALVGAVLLAVGLRGRRINDHPICRGCGFDLVGLYPGAARCPECGSQLAGAKAVRQGARCTRKGLLIAAIPLLLLGLGGGGVLGWSSATSYNWYAVSPDWLLEAVAGLDDQGKQTQAVGELAIRLGTRRLSGERADRLIVQGLAIQADEEQPWVVAWGDLIEAGIIGSRLTQAQKEAYLTNGFDCALDIPARVRQGEQVLVTLQVSSTRCGSNVMALLAMTALQLVVGDEPLPSNYDFGTTQIAIGGNVRPVQDGFCGVSRSGLSTSSVAVRIIEITLEQGRYTLSAKPEFVLSGMNSKVAFEPVQVRRLVQTEFEVIPADMP